MNAPRFLLATLALVSIANAQQPRPQRPVPLFNGKDLSGWHGNPAIWSVVDGVITGVSEAEGDRKVTENTFLIYEAGEVDDFELTLKARVTGANNSGVQYRSRVIDADNSVVAGYQLDIHPKPNFVGMLHEEKGRGILALRGSSVRIKPGNQKQVLGVVDNSAKIDISEWNEYSILARGSRLIHKINGEITCTAVDEDADKRSLAGVIAIQLHYGAPMKIEIKDIILQRFNRAHASGSAKTKPQSAAPLPQWIWAPSDSSSTTPVYFRRPWNQQQSAKTATLKITADDGFTAFLNGKEIGRGDSAQRAYEFDLTGSVRPNFNHLAVRALSSADPAGLVAKLEITNADGTKTEIVTDQKWTCVASSAEPAGWKTNPASRRDWRACRVIGDMGIEPWGDVFSPGNAADPETASEHPTTPPPIITTLA